MTRYPRLLPAVRAIGRVDAFIVAWTQVLDPRIAFLQQRGFPFLAYGRTQTDQPYPWFDFDNEAGARMAVERLIGLGHRRVAMSVGINTGIMRALRLVHW